MSTYPNRLKPAL